MAGRSWRRTASAQVSRRALIRVSSVLACSDMALDPLCTEDEQKGMNPTRARGRATLTRKRRRTARRTASVGGEAASRNGVASDLISSALALGLKSTLRRETHFG